MHLLDYADLQVAHDSLLRTHKEQKEVIVYWKKVYTVSENEKTALLVQNDDLQEFKKQVIEKVGTRRQWRKFRKSLIKQLANADI